MTKVIFNRKNGKIIRFVISGHTGKAEYGKDVLCAAISSVSQNALVGITEILNIKPEILKIDDGYLEFELQKQDYNNEFAQLLLESCLKSLKEIVKNEKKFVKLEEKNEI